jgi:hypothetical protein
MQALDGKDVVLAVSATQEVTATEQAAGPAANGSGGLRPTAPSLCDPRVQAGNAILSSRGIAVPHNRTCSLKASCLWTSLSSHGARAAPLAQARQPAGRSPGWTSRRPPPRSCGRWQRRSSPRGWSAASPATWPRERPHNCTSQLSLHRCRASVHKRAARRAYQRV